MIKRIFIAGAIVVGLMAVMVFWLSATNEPPKRTLDAEQDELLQYLDDSDVVVTTDLDQLFYFAKELCRLDEQEASTEQYLIDVGVADQRERTILQWGVLNGDYCDVLASE